MCGIVGIAVQSGTVTPEILERATRSLAHRGPDDSGIVIIRGPAEVGFGHRRLAVLDLSPLGHQPMQDAETGNWIVHNGEIYNFREIRKQLEGEGICFRSRSDTEVVLKAYGRWGENCLDHFRGMYAFAIWDVGKQCMFMARDPMGIKPLYYCSIGKYFLFASEIRALLATGLVPRRLDRAGLLNYLTFGSSYDPLTLVEGMSALRPGHFLTWQKDTVRETPFWKLTAAPQTTSLRRDQFEREIGEGLYEAVRAQMISDVPVGVFLSGGIDSSSLVALLSRTGVKPNTFSLVFRESDYSEQEYSRAVAHRFATNHQEVFLSQEDALDAIPSALQAMDQPSIDGLNSFVISQHTRAAGIKVALSGLGGDELFGGYYTFRNVPRLESFASALGVLPRLARKSVAGAFSSIASATDQSRKIAALISGNGSMLHPYFVARMLFTPSQRDRLAADGDAADRDRASLPLFESLAYCDTLDPISRVSYLETRCYMLNTLLRDSDAMSMAHGLELRVPLVDHRIAEMLFIAPGDWRIDRSTPKHLLVKAAGQLPTEIVRRPKRGFTLPFEHWLRDQLRPQVETTLASIGDGPVGNVVNPAAVRRVWDDFLVGKTSWSRPWSLYVLQRWCELNGITAYARSPVVRRKIATWP